MTILIKNKPFFLIFATFYGLTACQTNAPRQQSDVDRPPAAEATNQEVHAQPKAINQFNHPLLAVPAASAPQYSESQSSSDPRAAAPEDLWQRLIDGFELRVPDNDRIAQERRWYLKHPRYLQRVGERAEPFLHLIVEAVEERDMPLEIALLPVVESAFRPFAYSHGRAAGMWQFIPSTGRRYGLKQNWWYDGRRDVVASTRAALDYLSRLNKQFDGDWLLALAAYNSGSGTVRNAQARNRRKGKPTTFWHLDLPRETRSYVPRLLALCQVIANAEARGLALHPIANEPVLTQVNVGGQIDLALAADLADLSLEEIYQLNPAFNRWATDPAGPHRLLIPLDRQQDFETALANLPDTQRVQWQRYKIKPGEALGHLAKRFQTTVSLIQQVNGLKGHRIRAGQYLVIPVAQRQLTDYRLTAAQRDQARLNRKGKGKKVIHIVRKGDSLWTVARRYGVGTKQLARWNNLGLGDAIRPGQKLVLWQRAKKQQAGYTLPNVKHALPHLSTQSVYYTVRRGDSLARIASRFRVTVGQLCNWNDLKRSAILRPGQKLVLYVDVTKQT